MSTLTANGNHLAQQGEGYRAVSPALGARLLAAAKLVRPGAVVADIGCDHGKLAVYLALHGAPRVIAVDKRPLPLARAKALVAQTGCAGKVQCRLGDGLSALRAGEIQDIVIAGMSGATIQNILHIGEGLAKDTGLHFVFIPLGRQAQLRQYLCENGYAIQKEIPLEEKGRFYTVLSVVYIGLPVQKTALFYEVGLVPEGEKVAARGYMVQRLNDLQKRLRAPLGAQEKEQLTSLIQEVEKCLP